MKYICGQCGAEFDSKVRASFCPVCGCDTVSIARTRARINAEKTIQECNELIPEIEEAWGKYMEVAVKFEDKMQLLRQDKHRGTVFEEEIPKPVKMQTPEALKALRAARK